MKLTAKDKARFAKIVDLGCCICCAPPQIHHLTGAGMALKASNEDVMPLCARHHTGDEGIHTLGVKTWEAKYGTQESWIKWTKDRLNDLFPD